MTQQNGDINSDTRFPDIIKLTLEDIKNNSEYPEDYKNKRIADIQYLFTELVFHEMPIDEKIECAKQKLEVTYDIKNAPSKNDRYIENCHILKRFKTCLSM